MVGVVLGLHRLFCYDNNNQKNNNKKYSFDNKNIEK